MTLASGKQAVLARLLSRGSYYITLPIFKNNIYVMMVRLTSVSFFPEALQVGLTLIFF